MHPGVICTCVDTGWGLGRTEQELGPTTVRGRSSRPCKRRVSGGSRRSEPRRRGGGSEPLHRRKHPDILTFKFTISRCLEGPVRTPSKASSRWRQGPVQAFLSSRPLPAPNRFLFCFDEGYPTNAATAPDAERSREFTPPTATFPLLGTPGKDLPYRRPPAPSVPSSTGLAPSPPPATPPRPMGTGTGP